MKNQDSILAAEIIKKVSDLTLSIGPEIQGYVTSNADGIVRASGLRDVAYMELVEFSSHLTGVAVNLEEREVGILVLGDYLGIKTGDRVVTTGRILSVSVGEKYLGRVVDALGQPQDAKGNIITSRTAPVEKVAPSVTHRQPVSTSLATGIKAIDAMVPIGRGQRELIIGDRGTGKTTITLDTIINQKNTGVICIYVAIGQKTARVAQVIDLLEKTHSLDHTIVVTANASDPAPLQYLAPYTGCALGEYFMDQGRDVLIVYDDLTKHAWSYRQISLLLKRPSGREAYPGDIFYLHSRLLERSCRLNSQNGGGSLTALPIIETQAGDISAYIPTNVISITDGQIFLEPDLFYSGIRPAVSVGLSVSRVGGNAQKPVMKQVAGRLRLDLAQFRELAAFAQFASDLDETTRKQIEHGRLITELLKQPAGLPLPLEDQVLTLWAGANGHLSDVPLAQLGSFETLLREYSHKHAQKLLGIINKGEKISPADEIKLRDLVINCKKDQTWPT